MRVILCARWPRAQEVVLLLLLIGSQPVPVAGLCFSDNSSGFPMSTPIVPGTGLPACAAGFHCPDFNASDPATLPRYCTPTPECAVKRLFGQACEEPQGSREPVLCPAGSYCPTATAIVECPAGFYCLPAMTAPRPCPPLALCPAGSKKPAYFGGLITTMLLLVGLAASVVVYRRFLRPTSVPADFAASPLAALPSPVASDLPDIAVQLSPAIAVLSGGFRRARGTNRPFHISLRNLRVSGAGGVDVLTGVTADFAPAKVTAIIGPGGCGKTVLLNTILGRLPEGWARDGVLAINGDASKHTARRLRPLMGYVTQADVLHRELTVYQNLYYPAHVRLPADWSGTDRDHFLAAVLEALQLTAKRDMPIGDESTRGISGGQRRRTSIGVELAAAPMALFLDEPTSGLDSTTALEVCGCLKAVAAEASLTVAMTISQPRVEIWDALDEVLVLARGGRTVYQGPQHHAQAYFEAHCGIRFAADANPADIIVDAVAAQGPSLADRWASWAAAGGPPPVATPTQTITVSLNQLSNSQDSLVLTPPSRSPVTVPNVGASPFDFTNSEDSSTSTPQPTHRPAVPRRMVSHPRGRDGDDVEMSEVEGARSNPLAVDDLDGDMSPVAPIGTTEAVFAGNAFFKQVWLVHNRSLAKQFSDLQPLIVELVVMTLVAAVLGISLSDYAPRWSFKAYPLISVSVMAFIPQIFLYVQMSIGLASSAAGVGVFVNDRETYFREATAGFHRGAYFLGSVLASQVRVALVAMLFATIFHLMPRLYIDFWTFYGAMFLTVWCTYGLSAIFAMLLSARDAPLVAAVISIIFSCFSGFIPFPNGLKYLSHGFWASTILQELFFEPFDHVYISEAPTFGWPEGRVGMAAGLMVLQGLVYYTIAFVLMVSINRNKQR